MKSKNVDLDQDGQGINDRRKARRAELGLRPPIKPSTQAVREEIEYLRKSIAWAETKLRSRICEPVPDLEDDQYFLSDFGQFDTDELFLHLIGAAMSLGSLVSNSELREAIDKSRMAREAASQPRPRAWKSIAPDIVAEIRKDGLSTREGIIDELSKRWKLDHRVDGVKLPGRDMLLKWFSEAYPSRKNQKAISG